MRNPIDSVPKDRKIILWDQWGEPTVGYWLDDGPASGWVLNTPGDYAASAYIDSPTHWADLPSEG